MRFETFCDTYIAQVSEKVFHDLKGALEKQERSRSSSGLSGSLPTSSGSVPVSVLEKVGSALVSRKKVVMKKGGSEGVFKQCTTEDLSDQITLLEHELFASVEPLELLNPSTWKKVWLERATNILSLLLLFLDPSTLLDPLFSPPSIHGLLTYRTFRKRTRKMEIPPIL